MAVRPIIVHSPAQARLAAAAAATLGRTLTLASAPGAGGYAGPGWFGGLIAAVRAEHPALDIAAILDCGDSAGAVMAALRWVKSNAPAFSLCFTGDEAAARPLAEMAAELGVGFVRLLPAGLDLQRQRDPAAACRDWLTGVAANP